MVRDKQGGLIKEDKALNTHDCVLQRHTIATAVHCSSDRAVQPLSAVAPDIWHIHKTVCSAPAAQQTLLLCPEQWQGYRDYIM